MNIGGTSTTNGGTILRAGETQVAAGANVGDAGARYVFNVDNHAPYVGIGVLQQNNTPHTISILNAIGNMFPKINLVNYVLPSLKYII